MIHFIQHMFHIFLNWSGSSNPSGNQYGFWSGFGSDISEFLILGGVIQLYRRHNCHVSSCHRIGKHPVTGTPYVVCKRHHPGIPEGKVRFMDVLLAHKVYTKGHNKGAKNV